ncbi:unnamed protein product [Triticum turgidum subsp. durum]|uniref:Uncharacterized protein n=1 Tax=Triticum turgidum subsp. durum TaxID=4567 RepID=A0A9R1ALJ6_TRITD|nr:unnamed protein product [Triticum turgidum subsp. durum]
MSDTAKAKSPSVQEDEETGDSTEDEDWKKDAAPEDDSEGEEVELDDEEEEVVAVSSRKGKSRNSLSTSASVSTLRSTSGLGSASLGSTLSKKRKQVDVGALDCAKKFSFQPANTPEKAEMKVPPSCDRRERILENAHLALTGDLSERFGSRQMEKFTFLGQGRKDAKGRRPADPTYDPRTLFLPPQFLKNLTGGQVICPC